MAHRFEKGKHIYFLFKKGFTVQDSQLNPRYYLGRKKAEEYLHWGDEIVEYAPVVRCKDCKFFKYGDYCAEDKMEHSHAREDDYCSYGERKEADHE